MDTTFKVWLPALVLLGAVGPSVGRAADFGQYWYRGEAEITSYELQQARYGEIHPGHAVLVFVTEPFSRTKQVKLDDPSGARNDAVTVLKLNATRKFNTGIYPYSTMTSSFSPVTGDPTIKITTTVQEWCGHVFSQLNRTSDGYRGKLFSYFESEGDETIQLPEVLMEDALWTQIRLDPSQLPRGPVKVVPAMVHLRFAHRPFRAEAAEASVTETTDGLREFALRYAHGRELRITYRAEFPHEIEGWSETVRSGGRRLTTRASRLERIMSPYWRRNSTDDVALRARLGLPG
ncbi:MAG: septum formation inhibitor Maf [Myxococcota bacterium]